MASPVIKEPRDKVQGIERQELEIPLDLVLMLQFDVDRCHIESSGAHMVRRYSHLFVACGACLPRWMSATFKRLRYSHKHNVAYKMQRYASNV